jgi:hypothetical protein
MTLIVGIMKQRLLRCGINKKKKKEKAMHGEFQLEALKDRDRFEGLSVNGMILLNWILNNGMEGRGMDSSNSG